MLSIPKLKPVKFLLLKQVFKKRIWRAVVLPLVVLLVHIPCKGSAIEKGVSLKEYAAKHQLIIYTARLNAVVPLESYDQINNLQEEGPNILPLSGRELTDINGISELQVVFNGKQVPITEVPDLQIFLNRNRIKEIPEEISRMKNVSFFYFIKNRLTKIPDAVGELNKLQGIYFTSNKITVLPASLFRLTQLRKLEVMKNRISNLPEAIGNLQELIHFNVADNPLGKLPVTVCNLKKLRVCDFSRTGISEVPEAFAEIAIVHQLRLSGNPKLKHLPVGKGFEQMTGTIEITGTGINKADIPPAILRNVSTHKRPGTRTPLIKRTGEQ